MAYRIQYETLDKRWLDFSGDLSFPKCASAVETFERLWPAVKFRIHGTIDAMRATVTRIDPNQTVAIDESTYRALLESEAYRGPVGLRRFHR